MKWRIRHFFKKVTKIEGKALSKKWKLRKFVLINNKVQIALPDIYNGAFDYDSRRIYISKIPFTAVEFIIDELLKISSSVSAIMVEFDQYDNGHNVEIEIYEKESTNTAIPRSFDIQKAACSVAVSERVYFELISQLVIKCNKLK